MSPCSSVLSLAYRLALFVLADDIHGFRSSTNLRRLLRNSDERFDTLLRSQIALAALTFGTLVG